MNLRRAASGIFFFQNTSDLSSLLSVIVSVLFLLAVLGDTVWLLLFLSVLLLLLLVFTIPKKVLKNWSVDAWIDSKEVRFLMSNHSNFRANLDITLLSIRKGIKLGIGRKELRNLIAGYYCYLDSQESLESVIVQVADNHCEISTVDPIVVEIWLEIKRRFSQTQLR